MLSKITVLHINNCCKKITLDTASTFLHATVLLLAAYSFCIIVLGLRNATAICLLRNYSNQTVRLSVTLGNKEDYQRLPNKVTFYDTASKRKTMCGYTRATQLVSWTDTVHFYIDIPPFTVMDVNDVGSGNRHVFDMVLVAGSRYKNDTLMNTGNHFLHDKFHFKGGFSKYKYYYDFE